MKKTYTLFFVLLVLIACKNDDDSSMVDEPTNPLNLVKGGMETGGFGQIIYQDHTIVFNNLIKGKLADVEENSIILNYSESFELVDIGDVLFSSETGFAPNGFARKVTGISKKENTISFTTIQADATDTFKKIDYEEPLSLDFANIKNLQEEQSRQSSKKNQNPGLRIELDAEENRVSVILRFDYDNDFETTIDQLELEGFFEIEHLVDPSFILNFDPLNSDNNVLSISGLTDTKIGGNIKWGGKKSENFVEDDFLDPSTSEPLLIDRRFEIASIPFTGVYTTSFITQPEVVVFARVKVDITGKLYVEFSKDFRYNYNITYLGANTGDGWDYTFEELLDDDWEFGYGATAEIEYECTPFAFGPIVAFPQFLMQGNNPSYIGMFIYPYTYNAQATVEYDAVSNCFITDFDGKYQFQGTFESQISLIFNGSLDIDFRFVELPFTEDTTIVIPPFCFGDGDSEISIQGDLSFGEIIIGQSEIRELTISNIGTESFDVSSIVLPFNVYSVDWDSGIIQPGAEQTILVTFQPEETIIYDGEVEIINNASQGDSIIDISGIGIENTSIPTLSTVLITNITETTATSGGNVTDDGGANVTIRGVCWSTSPNPTTANPSTNDGTGLGNFVSSVSGLQSGTQYYLRAYATNSNGTAYGNQQVFTTTSQTGLPAVTTNVVSNIMETSATSGGNVTDDGGVSVTARGVCWSTNPNPTTANPSTNDGTGLGNFVSSISGLQSGTQYYLRAYATNSNGTAYGNQQVFTTTSQTGLPAVTTNVVSNIMETSATSGGNVTDDGGVSVTARGVCWSTNPNPTTANPSTNDGTGLGNFVSSISGLQSGTQYYLRAYATNSNGTAYGNEENFITESSGIFVGNVLLTTQQEVDTFGANNYFEVTGDVVIGIGLGGSPTNITNLTPLQTIETIGGSLVLQRNHSLVSLMGLNNLITISGALDLGTSFDGNDGITSLSGLESLEFIGGNLRILENQSLESIEGISALVNLNGSLVVTGNDSLLNIDELQQGGITNIGGDLKVFFNDNLNSLSGLINVTNIGGRLQIQFNGLLINLNGLDNVISIDEDLQVKSNSNLTDLCGITVLVVNDDLSQGYDVQNNAYNPTQQDIINGDCSQ